jgi:PGF-pre-PGF domain-containing protein
MKTYSRLIIIILAIFVMFSVSIMVVYGYGSSSSIDGKSSSIDGKDSYDNIFKYEIRNQNLTLNQSVIYTFVTQELSIYEILINGKSSESDISVKVEDLVNTSKYANESSPGIVYRNENVWIGTGGINYITVRFRVNNSWINDHNLNDSNYPHLLKWNGDMWLVLKTDIISRDGTYTYFEVPKAGSTSTAIFAISAQKGADSLPDIEDPVNIEDPVDVRDTASAEDTISTIDTSGAPKKYDMFEIALSLFIVAVVIYGLKRK